MPTYQYRCTGCGNELEAVQKFTDPALTECPACQGSLRKIYNAVGVVFKGSGFYRTDSRAGSAKTDGEGSGPATSAKEGTAKSPGKDAAKPAAASSADKPAASTSGSGGKASATSSAN